MATTTPFSIPFSSPYTLDEDIKFRSFYTGEPLPYVKKRVMGYNADKLIIGVLSEGQKERKVIFNISPDTLQEAAIANHPKRLYVLTVIMPCTNFAGITNSSLPFLNQV